MYHIRPPLLTDCPHRLYRSPPRPNAQHQNRSLDATGYIGGTVLNTLAQHHLEHDLTVLLRSIAAPASAR